MNEIFKNREKMCIWAVALCLLFMNFTGCKPHEKIYTIGIVSHLSIDYPILKGFREGMAESGYIEGQNIKYIYSCITELNEQNIDAGIKKLQAQDIDLLITTGNQIALRAKQLVKGTNMPVLFSSDPWPVEKGLVERLNHPGGNLTGIRFSDILPKALEWLTRVAPNLKKVYLPYNPNDAVSISALSGLDKIASQLGIELVLQKIHSVEESVAAIETLPKDVNAIFMIPSPTLNTRNNELSQAAIKRGIPTGAMSKLDEDVLMTFSSDYFNAGKKTARLAQQILHGAKPGDLPVETSEVSLIINLKAAEKIGLHVPDDVLVQAKTIIR